MRAFFALALLLGSPAAAQPPEPYRVDRAALDADLRFLADDALGGRGLGSPGLAAAAAYHEAVFRSLGLEPFDGQSYRQPFELLGVRTGPGTRLDAVRHESRAWRRRGDSCFRTC